MMSSVPTKSATAMPCVTITNLTEIIYERECESNPLCSTIQKKSGLDSDWKWVRISLFLLFLSHDPADYLGKGQWYSKELQYLLDNGYRFIKGGSIWHAVRYFL